MYQESTQTLFPVTVEEDGGRREGSNVLYSSNARVSRRASRWAWANRPVESIDSPVKRYLQNRPVDQRSRAMRFRRAAGRKMLRPAY